MEQLIFVVIWIVIALYQALSRKKKGEQKTDELPPRRRSRPPGTAPAQKPAAEEVEMPEFLRKFLGVEQAEPPPPPVQQIPRPASQPMRQPAQERPAERQAATAPAAVVPERSTRALQRELEKPAVIRSAYSQSRAGLDEKFEGFEEAFHQKADTLASRNMGRPKVTHQLAGMLRNPHELRRAILIKEVLQPPVSLRRGRYPYIAQKEE